MNGGEIVTKQDLEDFKEALFAELRRPRYELSKKSIHKEWLKSYEVRKLLSISPGTLHSLRRNGTLRFSKIGGLLYYKYEDLEMLINQSK